MQRLERAHLDSLREHALLLKEVAEGRERSGVRGLEGESAGEAGVRGILQPEQLRGRSTRATLRVRTRQRSAGLCN